MDGKQRAARCKKCASGGGKAAAAASAKKKLKRKRDEEAEPEARSNGAVEDEAMEWLVGLLEARGFEVAVTPEFRKADAAVRRPEWPEDAWLPIQLKSDGVHRDDGTHKPNDSKGGSGRATFKHCLDYEGMLLVCVKSRVANAKGDVARSVWVRRGDDVKTDSLHENKDGVLAPKADNIPRLSDAASGLADAIDTAPPSLRRSWFSIWIEVEDEDQRKEAAIMLALRVAGFTVRIPTGFQTVIDCYLDGTLGATQVKTYTIEYRSANACHRSKGRPRRAYHKDDGIDTLLEGVIVESGGRYFLLYAHQPADALLEHGVFAHGGYRGLPESTGKTCIHPPLGIFRRWLTGKAGEQRKIEKTAWLRKAAFGFRPPVELTEEKAREVGLPWEWVTDAATPAARPSAEPTDEQLEGLAASIAKHEEELARVSRGRSDSVRVGQPGMFENMTTTEMLRRLRVWRQRRRER